MGDFHEMVKAEDATITHLGHATMTVENGTVVDIEWDTPSGTAKQRTAERGNNPNGSGFYNQGHNGWLDIYYYNFNYPSINDMAATHEVVYTYDDKANAYTGIPLAFAMPDGSGAQVARFLSKHNRIVDGYLYNYDENGLLTSVVAENDSTFFHYIEQTLE